MEYEFSTEIDGEKLPVWHLYLDINGNLYVDPTQSQKFSDYDNMYLVSNVVMALANALLKSKVFSPKSS